MKIMSLNQMCRRGFTGLLNEGIFLRAGMVLALTLILALAGVQGGDRTPMTSNDVPFYARFEAGLIHTDGEWAAIAFYRPPSCVSATFNLLEFFNPAAFGCNAEEPYLAGFGIFQGGPFDPPIQSRLQLVRGQTLPVWFVSWSELEAAITDDVLTIGELEALPSLLIGGATFYTETLHPFQAAQQTMTDIVAFGYLEDGRAFTYQATETHGMLKHVKIDFN